MRSIKVYSEPLEWNSPDWDTIEQRLMGLLDPEDGFIVMQNKADDEDYVQTCLNTGDNQNDGVCFLETRMPITDGLKYYQMSMGDLMKVINDFKRFFDNESIDISEYESITDEFNRP